MGAKFNAIVCAVLLLAVAHTWAAPCIECKDCKGSNHCLQSCQKSCPRPQAVVNGEDCKRHGREAGAKVSKDACDTTVRYCNGGQKPLMGSRRFFPVSLGQCANIAYGLCQERAMDRWRSPCGHIFKGYKQCSKDEANNWYTGEVNDRCNQAVQWIEQKAAGKP